MSTLTAPIRRIWQAAHHSMALANLTLPGAARRQMHSAGRAKAVKRYSRRRPPDEDWGGEGGSGVREPRRPGPNPPAGVMALDEPTDMR